ncbi:terminase small subunit [Aeromonas phage phiA014S]|uniref:Terminase small subunit n=1 Tax=Aeromonas phage phiA014S TaxID=3119845 RepID=A0ABZ2CS35_9CAUD
MSLKHMEELLQQLDHESAKLMLKDLKNEEKRTPQLYNAIAKLLERHKFTLGKVVPDKSVLGDLAAALPDLTDDDLYQSH